MKKFLQICISCATLFPLCVFANDSTPTSINNFASSLYEKTLSSSDKNEIFSPYSLFQGLSMVYLGAQGKTQHEMQIALALDSSQEEFLTSLQTLNHDLSATAKLRIANRVWIDDRLEVFTSYQEKLTSLEASIRSLSFSDSAKSCGTINRWISEQTQGKIPRLLSPQDISANTRMVLVNAISFQDSWRNPFPPRDTHKADFTSLSGETKLVSMMEQEKLFPYYETEETQLLLLPFKSERFACFIILPKNSLRATEAELQQASFGDWIEQTTMTRVAVQMPRFTLRCKYPMLPMLSKLGIRQAFSRSADFSLISKEHLQVENVLHEAFFALDENGVSAAAATGVITGITSVVVRPTHPISFTANHPFLFGVVDLNSNVMLFLGKIVDL
ncbi:MAG: serpin family protein [Rhabdochlamydiaceae bacterium]|nr:serpin family protein [Rhabdochlamydiaceae bacterium]